MVRGFKLVDGCKLPVTCCRFPGGL